MKDNGYMNQGNTHGITYRIEISADQVSPAARLS